ncbi:vacuolar sorting protein VPS24 [Clavulina sp. PMI_390]|nr:vacuolar sorting protein VPS24 [Clavulina sp. PMI_390]
MYKSVNRWFYGPTPEEKVRAWQQKLRQESRQLDREMSRMQMAADKTKKELKVLAKRGDTKNARTLAKEIVRTKKVQDRMAVSKARLGSIGIQLQNQLALVKVTGSLQKSTEIMKLTNSVINLPQISAAMREMSMEMTKAGIMEEMVEETLEAVDDDEELEEEADAEVDKVLFELTDGKLGNLGSVGTELPTQAEEDTVHEQDLERLQQQLDAMLNG